LDSRESFIERDSSDDKEEEGSTDEGDLDELLKWPPEMLLVPSMSRHRSGRSDKRKAVLGSIVEYHGEERDKRERAGTGCGRHPMPD
jgi:hypothetical protein